MKKFLALFAVAAMTLVAQADVLTICDGTETNGNVPISGFNYDLRNTMSQMIYPSEKITEMLGGKISEVRFYATAGFALGQNNIQLSLKDVQQNAFDTADPVTGAIVVATSSTVPGETELVFTLDNPYLYESGNLLIETLLLTAGTFRTTNWYGMNTGYNSGYYQYQFNWGTPFCYTQQFLPKVTFTYEPAPAPLVTDEPEVLTWSGENGDHTQYVKIVEPEDYCALQYRYKFNNDDWTEWLDYDDVIGFTQNGSYIVEGRAKAPSKEWSDADYVTFEITPRTAVTEVSAGKTVAGVRYFNVAGQEMAQPNGLTIVVTTYTDGTRTAVKVMK